MKEGGEGGGGRIINLSVNTDNFLRRKYMKEWDWEGFEK